MSTEQNGLQRLFYKGGRLHFGKVRTVIFPCVNHLMPDKVTSYASIDNESSRSFSHEDKYENVFLIGTYPTRWKNNPGEKLKKNPNFSI